MSCKIFFPRKSLSLRSAFWGTCFESHHVNCIILLSLSAKKDVPASTIWTLYLSVNLTLPTQRLLSSKAQWRKYFRKPYKSLSCWYSLESSCWVLSNEYPYVRVSVILQLFASICIDRISHQQHIRVKIQSIVQGTLLLSAAETFHISDALHNTGVFNN